MADIPVEHDPFAAQPAAPVAAEGGGIPVEHDPFAVSAKPAAASVDADIPGSPAWRKSLESQQKAYENRSLGERALDVVGGTLTSTAGALAGIPILGAGGAALSKGGVLASKIAPKVGQFIAEHGGALTEMSKDLASMGPKALAAGGAAIGAGTEGVKDFLRQAYGMSEQRAIDLINWVTLGAPYTPSVAKAVGAILPTSAKTNAREIVQKLHGAGSDMITSIQQSEAFQKIKSALGVGGDLKGDADTIKKMLADAASSQSAEIRAEAAKLQAQLEKQSGKWGKVAETGATNRADASRVKNLGPDKTPSEIGERMKSVITPKAQQAAQDLDTAGRAGWNQMENEAAQQEASGNFIQDTQAAKTAVQMIDRLIEPDAKGIRQVSENSPLYSPLKKWRDQIKGDVVPDKSANYPADGKINFARAQGIVANLKSFGLSEAQIKAIAEKDLPIDSLNLANKLNERGYSLPDDVEALRDMIRSEYGHVLEARKSGNYDPQKMYYPGNADMETINAPTTNERKNMPAPQEIRMASMQTYDNLRRQLDELATPGTTKYDAVLASYARNISNALRSALTEHLPKSFNPRMLDYRDQAEQANIFKTRLGKALTEETPMGGEGTQSHRAAELAFAGKDSARKLKTLLGDQNTFDELALTHISSNLKGLDSVKAKAWLDKKYADWSGELSQGARQRVENYLSELKKSDLMAAAAKLGQKETAAKAAKVGGEAESKAAEITKTLKGGKESVDRLKELLTTQNANRDEERAVYTALQNTPNGKETFKRAVESVIKGADPKQILETFDYRIADKLIEMGSHTPQEVQQLRSVVQELDSIANASVAKSEDYGKAVRDAATHEAMKGKAIGSVLGGIVGAVGGHSQMGGLGGLVGAAGGIVGAGEGVGVYMNASAMVRNEKRIRELIDKIIADKDLFNAAMAPTSESSVKRLLGMLAKGAQTTGAVEVAEYPLQRERKAVRQ